MYSKSAFPYRAPGLHFNTRGGILVRFIDREVVCLTDSFVIFKSL